MLKLPILLDLDFIPFYSDILVSVRPGHLMVESQGVHQLVLDHHFLPTVLTGQLHPVLPVTRTLETNLGGAAGAVCAAASLEPNPVNVRGGLGMEFQV